MKMKLFDKAYAALDLAFQLLFASVGLLYHDDATCRLGVTTYLFSSGLVFAAFALMRIYNPEFSLGQVQVSNVLPFLNLGFVFWGRSCTWSQLWTWSFIDRASPTYCNFTPMATGSVALLFQLAYLFLTLFSMVGVLVVAFLCWIVAYGFISGSVLPFFLEGVATSLAGVTPTL